MTSKYKISDDFSSAYEDDLILFIRWIFTVLVILGCADLVIPLIFSVHIIPFFLFFNLALPTALQNVLTHMIKLHFGNIFAFTDKKITF